MIEVELTNGIEPSEPVDGYVTYVLDGTAKMVITGPRDEVLGLWRRLIEHVPTNGTGQSNA